MPIDMVEWRKQYYLKNRDKMLAQSKEYYEANKEQCKASIYANRLKHIESDPNYYSKKHHQNYLKAKEYHKEYYKQHREAIITRQKSYYKDTCKMKLDTSTPKYSKCSAVAVKQASIVAQLDKLLVKKEAFKKKLAEEAAANNNIDIP